MIQNHLLRVGGRLSHSLLEEDAKHPLILPADCPLTTLLIVGGVKVSVKKTVLL